MLEGQGSANQVWKFPIELGGDNTGTIFPTGSSVKDRRSGKVANSKPRFLLTLYGSQISHKCVTKHPLIPNIPEYIG